MKNEGRTSSRCVVSSEHCQQTVTNRLQTSPPLHSLALCMDRHLVKWHRHFELEPSVETEQMTTENFNPATWRSFHLGGVRLWLSSSDSTPTSDETFRSSIEVWVPKETERVRGTQVEPHYSHNGSRLCTELSQNEDNDEQQHERHCTRSQCTQHDRVG